MKSLLFYCAVALYIVSCSNKHQEKKETSKGGHVISGLPEMKIDRNGENWGGDVTLHIHGTERISAEITRYKIVSDYNGNPVGFDLLVKRLAKRTMFVTKGITFRSSGDTSNNFLKALADVYGIKQADPVFVDSITISYADLAAGMDMSKSGNLVAAQMKLFFETDEDTYELFLNIDEEAGIISLPEKDGEYRSGIIKALSKKK